MKFSDNVVENEIDKNMPNTHNNNTSRNCPVLLKSVIKDVRLSKAAYNIEDRMKDRIREKLKVLKRSIYIPLKLIIHRIFLQIIFLKSLDIKGQWLILVC